MKIYKKKKSFELTTKGILGIFGQILGGGLKFEGYFGNFHKLEYFGNFLIKEREKEREKLTKGGEHCIAKLKPVGKSAWFLHSQLWCVAFLSLLPQKGRPRDLSLVKDIIM
ncbi:hypothetical protein GOP47_0010823 [Adiantum capillus-veneris]|uniref:Uncharacterized protein n=1 Tax=Adiantum capillus-veneris TaxID=13818 RepID=A0A9D4UWT5_ADICA|nr:hypothetical protein GOP47_0010823 [Adiantum capillus-veneris]